MKSKWFKSNYLRLKRLKLNIQSCCIFVQSRKLENLSRETQDDFQIMGYVRGVWQREGLDPRLRWTLNLNKLNRHNFAQVNFNEMLCGVVLIYSGNPAWNYRKLNLNIAGRIYSGCACTMFYLLSPQHLRRWFSIRKMCEHRPCRLLSRTRTRPEHRREVPLAVHTLQKEGPETVFFRFKLFWNFIDLHLLLLFFY